MGNLKIKSGYVDKIPKINIQFDKHAVDDLEGVINSWGSYNPVVMINDYIPDGAAVLDLSINFSINKLPTFAITINDENFNIRKALKKEDIDTITVAIGGKNWLLKFYGIIYNSPSETDNEDIYLYGDIYNEKWYNQEQKAYKSKTVLDVIEDLCKSTDSGLYVFNNSKLDINQPYIVNPNSKYLSFLTFLLKNYTDCVWCYDNNGILYVGNIDDMRKSEVDKFKIYEDNILDTEKPIIITNYNQEKDIKYEKFGISGYTVSSDNGIKKLLSKQIYRYNKFDDMNKNVTTPQKEPVTNIYSKQITVSMLQNIFEINPFSIVDLELFLPRTDNNQSEPRKKDEELSGKKVVIGIEYIYSMYDGDKHPAIQQKLTLI